MATSLGSLVVSLGLDAADYTRGLTKAEFQAQQFSKNVSSAILQIGAVLGGLNLGSEFLSAAKDIISSAASLNDLADATGASVESLSKLSNQAKIAGTDFATLEKATLKISAAMGSADDGTNKAVETLKLLGITTRDPAQALQELAVKLNTYANGVNKVGLVAAIFGEKQGPQFLKVLQDMADLQDVAATVTKKQAEEAENLEKSLRRLSVEAEGFKNVILDGVVPQLNDMIAKMRLLIGVSGDVGTALAVVLSQNPFDTPAESVKKLEDHIVLLKKQLEILPTFLFGKIINNEIELATKQLQFLRAKFLVAVGGEGFGPGETPGTTTKPEAPKPPKATGGGGRAAVDRISEAQRFLDSLQRELDKTLELDTVTRALQEIQSGRLKGLTPDIQAQIIALAGRVDIEKELKKELAERAKAEEEAARVAAQAATERQQFVDQQFKEAEAIKEGNDAIRDQIAITLGGEEARKALAQAHIDSAIAKQQDLLATTLLTKGEGDAAEFIRAQIALLKERKGLLNELDMAEKFRQEAETLKQFADAVGNEFANSLADVVTGTKSLKDAIQDLGKSITRMLAEIAAKSLATSLFGGGNGQADIFDIITKLFSASSGPATSGPWAGFGTGPFAAAGTNFAFGGRTLVGEKGPEIVDLPRGARVFPNGTQPPTGGAQVIQLENHFHIQGTMDTRTQRQISRAVGDGVSRFQRDP